MTKVLTGIENLINKPRQWISDERLGLLCNPASVEGTRDVMNWTVADRAYNHALKNHMSFRYHALAWGSQYPSWIKTLTPTEFQEEMEEYMAAVAERYPLIDQIDVLIIAISARCSPTRTLARFAKYQTKTERLNAARPRAEG